MGLSMTRGKHMNSAGILMLAAEMNAFTKFVCMPMRGHGNVTGSDVVMRYTTGYPFGVNLCRGYPRFNPGEFSTVDLLECGDVDACPVLGRRPRRDDAAAGDRSPGPHPDDHARPEGDAHEPAFARPHYDSRDRHQSRTRNRVPDGRDPVAAASCPEVSVSPLGIRRTRMSCGGFGEVVQAAAGVVAGAEWGDGFGIMSSYEMGKGEFWIADGETVNGSPHNSC